MKYRDAKATSKSAAATNVPDSNFYTLFGRLVSYQYAVLTFIFLENRGYHEADIGDAEDA